MVDDEFSRAELKRLTTAIDRLTETVVSLERRIAETYVRQDVYERDRKLDAEAGKNLAGKIDSLISLRDWLVKIVVGAVILALLGLVLVQNNGGTLP